MCCLYYLHEYNWQPTLTLKLKTRLARNKADANEMIKVKVCKMKTGGRLHFWQQHTQSTMEWKWTEGLYY